MRKGESINSYVLDASIILCFLLPDEKSSLQAKKFAELIADPNNQLLSVPFLEIEVANAVRSTVLSGRLDQDKASVIFNQLAQLPIEYQNVSIEEALQLALAHQLSVYDAVYALLAQQMEVKLLTLDKKLRTRFGQ